MSRRLQDELVEFVDVVISYQGNNDDLMRSGRKTARLRFWIAKGIKTYGFNPAMPTCLEPYYMAVVYLAP